MKWKKKIDGMEEVGMTMRVDLSNKIRVGPSHVENAS